jgi:hypothetical protein
LILGAVGGRPLLLAAILMMRKDQVSYEQAIGLLDLPTPKIIMINYEMRARNAARKVWPDAKVQGCMFHYNQANHRHAREGPLGPMLR